MWNFLISLFDERRFDDNLFGFKGIDGNWHLPLQQEIHNFYPEPHQVKMFNFVVEKPQVKMYNFWRGKLNGSV